MAVGSRVTRKSWDKDVVVTKDTHPAIVSEEEYEIARSIILNMKKPDYKSSRTFALKGKVRCGNCRRSMVLIDSGADARMYCPHKKQTGKFSMCSDEMVSVSVIEGNVWYALRRVFHILDAMQSDYGEKAAELDSSGRKKRKQLELKSDILKSERMRKYEAYAEGMITKDEYLSAKRELTDNINALQEEAERFSRLSAEEEAYKNKVASVVELLENEMKHEKITQDLADALIDTVYVYDKKRIEVVFTFEDILMKAMERYQKEEGKES